MNKQLIKTPIPEQDPQVRAHNFKEVSLGYTEEQAVNEAQRCLNCKNQPCVSGCPVNVKIPQFIQKIISGDYIEADKIIHDTNSLPAICGRVCPQESQCEAKCVRGIKGEPVAIGRLERFVADFARQARENDEAAGKKAEKVKIESKGKKVAVVGGGPAGLTCAGDLARLGYEVTIFEALHKLGGVLSYGIPEFRLPKDLVQKEIDAIKDLPVKMMPNIVIGKSRMVDELFEQGYEAIFIGSGAGLPKFQRIEGENLNGVYSANEFLTRINLMKAYDPKHSDTPVKVGKHAVVIGGGNVAMDSARCALRMGAEDVKIVYRRSEKEMPARIEEVHHAKEEGIDFAILTNPIKINGDENSFAKSMTCIRMELGECDLSGRCRPIPVEGSEFDIPADTIIVAIGNNPNPLIKRTTPEIKTQPWGGIIVDEETGETTKPGVYAGGDAVTGAATVILAMGAGKKAAAAMDKYLSSK